MTGGGDRHPRRAGDGDEAGPDRGLQAERTELAWIRTALVCAALASLSAHIGGASPSTPEAVAAALVVGGFGVAAAAVRIAALRRRGPGGQPAPPSAACVGLLTASVVAADLLVLVQLLI